jgi:DNA-binding CsgD family transcriptional regulator
LCRAFGLTPRETDIVVLLVAGEGPAEIAARLEFLSAMSVAT